MKSNKFNEKGLTLIELLAVIVIIAIVSAIAIPSISNVIQNQRDKAIISDIMQLVSTAKISIFDDSCGDDKICKYNKSDNSIDELGFNSSKFTEASVDFSGGSSPNDVEIWTNIVSSVFKGRNKQDYIDLIGSDGKFTEKELRDIFE